MRKLRVCVAVLSVWTVAGHVSVVRIEEPARFLSLLSFLLAFGMVGTNAQVPASLTYKLPTKETKLDAKGLERVLSAKTVAVLAASTPFITNEDRSTARMTYRGRRVGPEKAKADVEKVLSEWGAFGLVDDSRSGRSRAGDRGTDPWAQFASDGKVRLKNTLAVFPTGGPGVAPPLWVGIDTESALAAASGLTTPDAEGVVEKFRRDIENARNRLKK